MNGLRSVLSTVAKRLGDVSALVKGRIGHPIWSATHRGREGAPARQIVRIKGEARFACCTPPIGKSGRASARFQVMMAQLFGISAWKQ